MKHAMIYYPYIIATIKAKTQLVDDDDSMHHGIWVHVNNKQFQQCPPSPAHILVPPLAGAAQVSLVVLGGEGGGHQVWEAVAAATGAYRVRRRDNLTLSLPS